MKLEEAVRSPGFTPSVRDLPDLVALLARASDDEALVVERAIFRIGDKAVPKLVLQAGVAPPLRARVCRAIGRFSMTSEEARAFLVRALADDDAKTRRNAIIALGKVPKGDAPGIEAALVEAWGREARPDHKRSIAASLGKIGSASSLELLRAVDGDDPELARIATRGKMMLERDVVRQSPGGIDGGRAPAEPVRLIVHCRAGLEEMLGEELGGGLETEVVAPGKVRAVLHGPLESLFRARTMTRFGFAMPEQWVAEGEDVGAAVVRAVTSEEARRIFETWTVGAVRYRLAWGRGGHRRAVVWRCAEQIAALRPELVNDPTESLWEVIVNERRRFVDVEIAPRALVDPRFAYRTGDVPAASHPTVAAALARVAGAVKDDVVWDPFVGSGTELVERAKLGPYARLLGSDRDARAIGIAKANLDAAGVERVDLEVADALAHAPKGVTLILSNPPMGRRVVREVQLGSLLERFVDHAATLLVRGGRLVWLSPFAARTAARANEAGLEIDFTRDVDMGGFTAQLQRMKKR